MVSPWMIDIYWPQVISGQMFSWESYLMLILSYFSVFIILSYSIFIENKIPSNIRLAHTVLNFRKPVTFCFEKAPLLSAPVPNWFFHGARQCPCQACQASPSKCQSWDSPPEACRFGVWHWAIFEPILKM